MKKVEDSQKSSFIGVAAIIVSIIVVLSAAIYYYCSIPSGIDTSQEQQFTAVLEQFNVTITSFLIVFYGNLLSLILAVISLVRKERKVFPLIAVILALTTTIIAALIINES